MTEDRVDYYVNHLHVTCLTLLRLKKVEAYSQDPSFMELLGGFLNHSRQLMDLIRDREEMGKATRGGYTHPRGTGNAIGVAPRHLRGNKARPGCALATLLRQQDDNPV